MKHLRLYVLGSLKWILAGVVALALQGGMTATPAYALDLSDCGRPNPGQEVLAYCESNNIPRFCFRPILREDRELYCDQKRFRGQPHFNLVKLAGNGAVRSIHLISTETGEAVFTAYPYGKAFAIPAKGDRKVKMRTEFLSRFLKKRATPTTTQESSTGYATGLQIGWNNSTGVTPGQCFNYTIATPSNNFQKTSFSSQDTANSTAEQIKVSTTVSGAYEAFKASDTFSFSDNYQSSANSGNQYFNLYSLYTLNNTISETDPLTAQGKGAGNSFSTLCGGKYLSSVPVGMVATINTSYGSTSSSTQTDIDNAFKASYGLDTVTNSVKVANSDSNSSSYFTFNMVSYGGGFEATSDLNKAFAMTNSNNEAYYALCGGTGGNPPNSNACATFVSNMGTGATNAIDSFNQLVANLSSEDSPDLSFLKTFPNGVAGAATTQFIATAIPETISDVLEPYKSELQQYITLLNEIATLNNRTKTLNSLVTQSELVPKLVLDIESYLDRLENIYKADRNTLLSNLETCLGATESNVKTVCEPIIDNTITNALEWYDPSNGENPSFFAQQNTLALQYKAGTWNQDSPNSIRPLDVIYIDELPSSSFYDSPISYIGAIKDQAALVGFADRSNPVLNDNYVAILAILALEPDEPLSTNNLSSQVAIDDRGFWWWTWVPISTSFSQSGATFSTQSCTPTWDDPCAIDVDEVNFPLFNDQIEDLFD